MYESPITIETYVDAIVEKINHEVDETIYEAMLRSGVTINRCDLEKALKQDYDRYTEAYEKGFRDGKAEANKIARGKLESLFAESDTELERRSDEHNTERD